MIYSCNVTHPLWFARILSQCLRTCCSCKTNWTSVQYGTEKCFHIHSCWFPFQIRIYFYDTISCSREFGATFSTAEKQEVSTVLYFFTLRDLISLLLLLIEDVHCSVELIKGKNSIRFLPSIPRNCVLRGVARWLMYWFPRNHYRRLVFYLWNVGRIRVARNRSPRIL